MKMKILLTLTLLLNFSSYVFAQDKPAWIASLEDTLKKELTGLKIQDTEVLEKRGGYSFMIRFDDFRSHIQMTKYSTTEKESKRIFGTDVDLYSKTFGRNSKKQALENFADEGYVWANIENEGWTRISFRRKQIFVNVFTSDETLARKLAQSVLEKMPGD